MPHGGQSSFPVHVALPGQVSWETATSHPAIVRGKGQWLHHTETLCQVPGASWKQKGAGRSREGDLRLGVSRGAGVSQALPMPLPLRFRPGPHLCRLDWFAGHWWGSLQVWYESHSASRLLDDPGSSPFISLHLSFLLYKMEKLTEPASLEAQLVKNLPAKQEVWFDPWVGKIPWRRKCQPTPGFLPGNPMDRGTWRGYSPWATQLSD